MSGPQMNMPQVYMGSDGLHFQQGSMSAPQLYGPTVSDPYMSGPQMNVNTPSWQPGMPSMPGSAPQMPQGMPGGLPPVPAAAPSNKMLFIALGVLLLIAIIVVIIFVLKK